MAITEEKVIARTVAAALMLALAMCSAAMAEETGYAIYGAQYSQGSGPGVIIDPGVSERGKLETGDTGTDDAEDSTDTSGESADTAEESGDTSDNGTGEESTGNNDSTSGSAEDTDSGTTDADVTDEAGDSLDTAGSTDITDAEAAALEGSLSSPNTLFTVEGTSTAYINGRLINLDMPVIALTYDDGPQTTVGNSIMDTMAAYGQKCTFFMVGERVPSMAATVQRMVAEGHEIANHTYSHRYLNKVSASEIVNQVTSCNSILQQTTGVTPQIMRLPGGNKNDTVLANVNMPIILWNIDTLDWKTRNAQSTIDSVLGNAGNGDIVLMHELYQATADATAVIVPALVERGFQLLTVSEMAAVRGVALNPGQVYYSF